MLRTWLWLRKCQEEISFRENTAGRTLRLKLSFSSCSILASKSFTNLRQSGLGSQGRVWPPPSNYLGRDPSPSVGTYQVLIMIMNDFSFQDFRRDLQGFIGTRANINIAQIENYGGETFLSEQLVQRMLIDANTSFLRCKTVWLPIAFFLSNYIIGQTYRNI